MISVTRTGYSKNKPLAIATKFLLPFSIASPTSSETFYDTLSYLMVTDNLFYNIVWWLGLLELTGWMQNFQYPDVLLMPNPEQTVAVLSRVTGFKWTGRFKTVSIASTTLHFFQIFAYSRYPPLCLHEYEKTLRRS